jgi:hypothetical protein
MGAKCSNTGYCQTRSLTDNSFSTFGIGLAIKYIEHGEKTKEWQGSKITVQKITEKRDIKRKQNPIVSFDYFKIGYV